MWWLSWVLVNFLHTLREDIFIQKYEKWLLWPKLFLPVVSYLKKDQVKKNTKLENIKGYKEIKRHRWSREQIETTERWVASVEEKAPDGKKNGRLFARASWKSSSTDRDIAVWFPFLSTGYIYRMQHNRQSQSSPNLQFPRVQSCARTKAHY